MIKKLLITLASLVGLVAAQTNVFIPMGGIVSKSSTYTAVATDVGKTIQMNCNGCSLLLPNPAPYDQWSVFVENLNANPLTIDPNTLLLDGSAATLSIAQNTGIWITSNGTNYGSVRGGGGGGGGGGGSGTVSNPSCGLSPDAFYPSGFITTVQGDCFTSDDALGNKYVQSITTLGALQGKINSQEVNNIRYSNQYNWSRSPSGSLTGGTPATVILNSISSQGISLPGCPFGIDTSNNAAVPYYVYIAGTGTPEAVQVNGGSCTGGLTSGTITFTPLNSHTAGFTVQSASGGITEAMNDAGTPNSRVVISPTGANNNAIQVYAPLFIAKNKLQVDAYGAHIQCSTRSYCVHIGDTTNANDFDAIRVHGLRVESLINVDGAQITNIARTSNVFTVTTASAHNFSMTANAGGPDIIWLEFYPVSANIPYYHGMCTLASVIDSTHFTCTGPTGIDIVSSGAYGWTALENAAIEDNAQGSTMQDIVLRTNGASRFHYVFVIDNDQSAKILGYESDASGVRSTSNFVGYTILGRVDGSNSSVIYVRDSDISLQCAGNGIRQLSGNSLHVSDSVIQGFSQVGIFYEAGLQSLQVDNVYEEAGGCVNPYYPGSLGAQAGLIQRGQTAVIHGNSPLQGLAPTFATGAGTQRNYYIVPRSVNFGYGPILYAGSTTAASGTVNVYWPQVDSSTGAQGVVGAITYDVLYTTGINGPAPYAGNATSLATGISGSCVNSICTFADLLTAGSAYTVNAQQFIPNLVFWPSGLVVSSSGNEPGGSTQPAVIADIVGNVSSAWGTTSAQVFSFSCGNLTAVASASWTYCLDAGPNAGTGAFAMMMQQQDPANNGPIHQKGRINIQPSFGGVPTDVFTWADSNLAKTLGTSRHRPIYDAADCATGFDQGTSATNAGLAIRCAAAITQYINSLPDNSSWLERLTSTNKTFKVNVSAPSVTGTGAGAFVLAGTFGTCPSPPSITQSALCYGAGGTIYASFAGGAYQALVTANNIPATGITGSIDISQLNTTELDARYIPINSIPQDNSPVGGATGAGLQAGPCQNNSPASGFYNCNTNFLAGAGIPNDTTTGTTLGLLAKLSAGKMVKIGTSDTNIPVYLITNNPGTTGNTWPLVGGTGSCTFDGATTANDFVGASPTVAGDCTDLGSSFAGINGNKTVIGQVLTTNGSAGTYLVLLTQAVQTPFYQTIKNNGTAQTQRSTLNIKPGTNVTISAVDNSGAGSTDVTINASGGGGTGNGFYLSDGKTGTGGAGVIASANVTRLWAFTPTVTVTTSTKLVYGIQTADNSANLYNIAIFDGSGNIVCQTGAVAGTTLAPSIGQNKTISWSSSCGPITSSTLYYLGYTGQAQTMVLDGLANIFSVYCNQPASGANNTTASAVWTTPIAFTSNNNTNCTFPNFGFF